MRFSWVVYRYNQQQGNNMKRSYNDLNIPTTGAIPATISIYRGEHYDNYQEALESGAIYNVYELHSIFAMTIDNFSLAGAMTVADMFGHTSMVFAVHDDTQLFFEEESSEITEEYLDSYQSGLAHYHRALQDNSMSKYTILGWNSYFGGSFAVECEYPTSYTIGELTTATELFISDISRDHALDSDPDSQDPENILFITNVIEGHHANAHKAYGHTKGHDQYNFPYNKKQWNYKLTTNTIWFGGDSGSVMARNYDEAKELAMEELETHIAKINRLIGDIDIIEVDLGSIELEEAN
jgi:hypothetical protein